MQAVNLGGVTSAQSIDTSVSCLGDHVLLRSIAAGSYGEVWLARNQVGTLRAVKVVRRDRFESEADFEREFRGLKRFEPVSREQEGLVDILTLGMLPDDAGFYCVMELADNAQDNREHHPNCRAARTELGQGLKYVPHSLRAQLKSRGALPAQEVIAVGLKLSSALVHLHRHGLVHRDVKPSNILFIGGEPKLADAGLVAPLDDAKSLVGTIGYIAPEGPGSPKADVYALGKVLYEAAFGKNGDAFPRVPADIPLRLDHKRLLEVNEVIARACAPDSRDRYHSAEKMRADLELLSRGKSIKAQQGFRQVTRRATWVLAVLGVTAILSAVTLWPFRRHKPDATAGLSRSQEANDAYRQGMWIFHQNTPASFRESARLFALAVEKDPNFARANARLARSYIWQGPNNLEMLLKARPYAKKALALDPQSDEAHTAMASIQTLLEHDWAGAEKHHLKAIRLNGDGPYAEDNLYGYSSFLSILGRTNEAIAQVEKALALGSRSLVWMQNAAFVYLSARQYDRAISILTEIIQQQPSIRDRLVSGFLLPAYRAKGDYVAALQVEEGNDPMRGAALREAYEVGKESGYWLKHLEFSKEFPSNRVWLGTLHSRTGDYTAALTDLEQAAEAMPNQLAFEINREPSFDPLRRSPRFENVRKRLGFK